ncbi:MAG: PAS domain S-box protein, partial [Thermoplasmata archaeon]|nr:PAS domain S-box protein [Thermoplasmata archaeon]
HSPSVMKLRGYTPEEANNISLEDTMVPESMPLVKRIFEEENSKPMAERWVEQTIELNMYRKDGSVISVEASLKGVRDTKGNIISIQGRTIDITERKKAEEALKESEERYRHLFSMISDAVYLIDQETGSIIDVNETACEMYGYTHDEWLSMKNTDVSAEPKETRKSTIEPPEGIPIRYHKKKDGTVFPLEMTLSAFELEGRKVILAAARDITERKKSEEALKESAYYLTKAQEIGMIGTWELNIANDVLVWTDEAYRIFGLTIGTPLTYEIFQNCIHPDDREYVNSEWAASMKNNDYDIEHRIIVDDKIRWVREKADIEYDDKGKPIMAIGFVQDITERKKDEKALKEGDRLFKLITENMEDEVWLMDMDLNVTFMTQSVLRDRGYSLEDMQNMDWADHLTPESLEVALEGLELALTPENLSQKDKDVAGTLDLEFYHKDGHTVWADTTIKVIRDENGEPIGLLGVAHDITERKMAERALSKSEEMYKSITERMSDILWICDLNFNTTYVSPSVEKSLGFTPEERMQQTLYEQVTPEMLEYAAETIADELQHDADRENDRQMALPIEYYHKDGTVRLLESSISFIRDEKGKPVGIQGLSRDITERKKAENALKDSENRLNIIFESAPDAYYLNDFEGTFMDGNKAAEELLGYSREELIGKDFADAGILPMEQVEKALNLLAENINGKTTGPDEFTLKRKDGSKVDVEILTHPVKIGGKDRILGIARDITERKMAEEALANSEERFNQVAKHSMEWIWEIDAEGKFIYASQMCEEVYGYKPDELIGKYFYELAAPEIRDKIKHSSFKEIIKKKKSFKNTLNRCIHKDGKYIWIKSSGFPILDEKGNLAGYRGSDIDVSEQIRIEEAIDESEEKFRAVFNEALDGIVLINADNGIIIDANPEFQRISGRSISQLRALRIWDIRPEDKILLAKDTFKNIKNIDDHLRIIETQFLQPSGDIVPVEFKAHKVVIRNNEYILTIARDMTQIVQAKEDIKSSEEKFQNLFEESLDAVYITDKDGTVIDINLAGCNMLGYSRDEMVGINAVNTYFQEEDRLRLQQEIREKGSVQDFEVVLKRKDGSQIFCLISATSKKDSKGNITSYQGIIHDLTDRIIIEQRYRDEFERAEFYNDLMSHDVRNYNQGIMSNLELMNLSEDLSESAKRFSRNALNQVIGSSKLINNLQTLSDLKHSKASLDDMDIIPFIGEALDYTKTSFTDKTLKVNFPDEGKSIIVKGNSMLLEVFNNLLTNAVKFDRNQEVHIEINISEDENFYKFEFKDHGPGIEDNMKSRVFDRNIRTDEGIWGTGLGLTLVKQIVDTIGGDIWVEDR